MTEKKPPEKRGDVQTEEAQKNVARTEERIREENSKVSQKGPQRTDAEERGPNQHDERSEEGGGEESKHGRKQKGNSEPT
jgi:hypothetical protein